jgi:[ribosomal protein S5]-alanine N-acetyltransferase
LKTQALQIQRLTTGRLILVPFTTQICTGVLNNDYSDLFKMGLKKGQSWPDADVIETLPKIINNLSRVGAPTGFESWMIIKKDTLEIIGDLGFKGFNHEEENVDIGYGIIKEERRKGYAEEAAAALIAWAFSNAMVKAITASCAVDNIGSMNLLRKLHFTQINTQHGMIGWSLQRGQL